MITYNEPQREGEVATNVISIAEFMEKTSDYLSLKLIAGKGGLSRTLKSAEINRPDLALTGFVELFTYDRIQILGNTEALFLNHLSSEKRRQSFEIICQFELPCIVFTGNNRPHKDLIALCEARNIPLFVSKLPTTRFIHLFSYYTEDIYAPVALIHGTLVDVYGIGLLFRGKSGIGKSEIALDLIERGHRLVADDVVRVKRMYRGILMGRADSLTHYFLEIRGIGLVDVKEMFGARSTRIEKRIEVEVNLVLWEEMGDYARTGLDESISTILNVDISRITVPLVPGKYVAVIVEAVALNHLLRSRGYHAAEELDRRLKEELRRKALDSGNL